MKRNGAKGRVAAEAGVPLEQFPQLQVRLDTILMPIDFSPGSRRALAHALPLARHFRARLVLIHVVKLHQECVDCGYGEVIREWPDESLMRRAREHLRGMVRTLEKPHARLETAVRSGEPASEIVAAAKELRADLIVIGTRGLNPELRDPMGSTAERVAREAGCPVLVVRQKEHDFVEIPAAAAPRRTRAAPHPGQTVIQKRRQSRVSRSDVPRPSERPRG